MNLQTLALVLSLALFGLLAVVILRLRQVMDVLMIWPSRSRFWTAVFTRIVFGGVLLAAAPDCRYPLLVTLFATLTLAAGIGVLLAGRTRLDRLLLWFVGQPEAKVRLLLGAGIGVMATLVVSIGV